MPAEYETNERINSVTLAKNKKKRQENKYALVEKKERKKKR